MLHDFLTENRQELIRRCEAKVKLRDTPAVGALQTKRGVPDFLTQLGEALRGRRESPVAEESLGSPAAKHAAQEGNRTAAHHGKQMHEEGYTVDQVVHDFGDVCQAITELAKERGASVTVEEFRILNRMLDNAIADAVSSYEGNRDRSIRAHGDLDLHERLGILAEKQRNCVNTALRALAVLKTGDAGLRGATGSLLEDSLLELRELIDKSHPELRLSSRMVKPPQP
jgi:hypothetical protein